MVNDILRLMGKKYSYEMLNAMVFMKSVRFKDLRNACPIEKMRTQRLKELEVNGLIGSSVVRIGRRPVLAYSISEKGKKVLKSLEGLKT